MQHVFHRITGSTPKSTYKQRSPYHPSCLSEAMQRSATANCLATIIHELLSPTVLFLSYATSVLRATCEATSFIIIAFVIPVRFAFMLATYCRNGGSTLLLASIITNQSISRFAVVPSTAAFPYMPGFSSEPIEREREVYARRPDIVLQLISSVGLWEGFLGVTIPRSPYL